MYRYDEFDAELVNDRAEQFRRQTARRIAGELTEEQFRPLRLMNGLYLQLHAYMLRINVPYGVMSSRQLRKLAQIARDYDKGYGHWTTRQNLQLNWIQLQETPDILKELASVEMHCIQSSGNCIRNTTADEYAGVAADEIEDPRVYAELIRQWSTLHPEFSFLPRKFKIALTGSPNDRAAVKVHDIGLIMHRNDAGKPGFEVIVGGGLGRTPFVGKTIRKFIETRELLSYLEAILRVYNRLGRRDNKYKARIKILVHETGTEEFTRMVEEEYTRLAGGALEVPQEEIDRIDAYFAPPDYRALPAASETLREKRAENPAFDAWVEQNTHAHKQPGYIIANITVKTPGRAPGDMSSDQMEAVADLSDTFSFGELRVTHRQNLTLTDVEQDRLFELWERLVELDLATANHALIGDIIACPGLDYCALANARSIPVAQEIATRFEDIKRQKDVGPLELNISGCINACGHHHVGNIGILGVDRAGEELYQLQLGGCSREDAALADITGRGFAADKITDAVETVIDTYLELRNDGETFLDTYRRVGMDPFKQKLYDAA
ncbi:MAG: nitrite/sulfite reductase [Myxococcota bacterium]